MIFDELDARMSWVPRWVVVPTLQKQSVAEHCFNVERIARRIAEQWFGIRDTERLDRISQLALHHDDDEAVTGDIPSPAKTILSEEYLDERSRVWYNAGSSLRDIIKLADLMEMCWFLTMDRLMGNQFIDDYLISARTSVKNYAARFNIGTKQFAVEWMDGIAQMRGTTRDAIAGSTKSSTEGGI
jgi:hypothetical protein